MGTSKNAFYKYYPQNLHIFTGKNFINFKTMGKKIKNKKHKQISKQKI